MHGMMALFTQHAYSVLFGWVLVEQGGLPIPSIPLLLAAGIGVPLGMRAALRPGGWIDGLCSLVSTLGQAMPTFFLGLLLVFNLVYHIQQTTFGLIAAMTMGTFALALMPIIVALKDLPPAFEDIRRSSPSP